MISITRKVLLSSAIVTSRYFAAAMSTSSASQNCSSGKSAVIFLHGLGDVSCSVNLLVLLMY